jgi:hypothetical protein
MGTSLGTLNLEITGSTFTPGETRSRPVAPAGGRRGFADPSSRRSETGHLRRPNRTTVDLDHLPSSVHLSKHDSTKLASGIHLGDDRPLLRTDARPSRR